MTTFAISDGVVAVDSQGTSGGYAVRVQKLARLPDGGVAVGCGSFSAAYAGLKWLAEGEKGDGPEIDGAQVVIVRPDGSIWIAEERWPAFPILDRTFAGGCGADLARLLMAQGKDPVTAVAEACEHDAMSSGPILSMSVIATPDHVGPDIYEVRAAGRKRGKR